MQDTDLAWAAGIVDGEGCISLSRVSKRNQEGFDYRLGVRVSMTHEPTIRKLHEIFKLGSITKWMPAYRESRPNERTLWIWHVSTRQSEVVLAHIYPYLVTKREQAQVAFKFLRLPTGNRYYPPSEIVLHRRELCYKRMRAIK